MRYWCVLLATASLAAQEIGELSTERPGFTATSGAVGLGVLQLEQGYLFESARDAGAKLSTFTGPQAVLRFGLTESLEVRFSTNGYSWQTQEFPGLRTPVSGPGNSSLGAKLRVISQRTARPEVAVTAMLSLPSTRSGIHHHRPGSFLHLGRVQRPAR